MVNLFTKARGDSIGRMKSVFSTDSTTTTRHKSIEGSLHSNLIPTADIWYGYFILKHIFKRGDHATRVLFFGPAACGISCPWPGTNLHPWHWKQQRKAHPLQQSSIILNRKGPLSIFYEVFSFTSNQIQPHSFKILTDFPFSSSYN